MIHPKEILNYHRIQPKKSLGQNFLADVNVLQKIAAAADLTKGDHILEIGPGLGALTRVLAEKAAHVVAVELDGRLIPILQNEFFDDDNVTLVHGDILKQNPADWFSQSYKVIANVPYYITGAILRHLLSASQKPSLMALTIQKEVAERIIAKPPQMSLLAVSVQYYGIPTIAESIKAGAFWPRPDVDSTVLRIDLQRDLQRFNTVPTKFFFRVAKAGFSQKRKQLKNNLRVLGYKKDKIAQALDSAGIDGKRRAQTLTLEEWEVLAWELSVDGSNSS